MNRPAPSVFAPDLQQPMDSADSTPAGLDLSLARAGSWLERVELVSRGVMALPGLATALHWAGAQLGVALAARRFQVWQVHDWRDGAGLIQPWMSVDDEAGVQRIDLAELDLLREGEGALGLALAQRQAAVAPVGGRSGSASQPGDSRAAGPGARLCLALPVWGSDAAPLAALEWWLDEPPPDDALLALDVLARLLSARAQVVVSPGPRTRHDAGAAVVPQPERPADSRLLALALALRLPVSLVVLDTELNVLQVNRQALREFGLGATQASGQGLGQLFGVAAGQDLAAGAAQASARDTVVEQQLVIATPQGPRRVTARSSALRNVSGDVELLLCQFLPGGRVPADETRIRLPAATMWRRGGESSPPSGWRDIADLPRPSTARAPSLLIAPRAAVPKRAGALDQSPVDVLVIDDHEVNQEVMAQMLRRLGCQVRCAGSAEAGLLALCDGPSDLVLMDLEMPGMHGMEALAWLRRGACDRFALQVPASTPVVAVTAHALAGDGERCLAQGFDAYLAKPCRLEDLRDVVQGLLGRLPLPAIDEAGIVPGRAEVQRFDAYQSVVPVDGSSEAACLASRLPSQASERASDTTSIKEMAINEKNGDGMPVFDPQALVRLRALDPKGQNQLLVRVMKAFEVSLQRMSVQLASAWQQRDLTGIRQVAHTLKSSSASVGALRVSGLCLEVETSLRGVQADAPGSLVDGAREPVDQLLAEIERVRQALPGWLNDAQSSSRSGD